MEASGDGGGRPTALVTGASSGIGLELARTFLDNGFDVVINAEDRELANAQEELSGADGSVTAIQADLTRSEEVERLWRESGADRTIDVVAINAGVGFGGRFEENPLERELEIVDLNVRSTLHLAKLAARDMTARGAGRMLFTSSIASTLPGPFQAVYNASKSFVQSFALALREELAESDVGVTLLMPGATETEFFDRAEMQDTKVGAAEKDDAAEVARDGFEALMAGEERAVAGSTSNKVQAVAGKVIPDSRKAKMFRKQSEPGSAEDA